MSVITDLIDENSSCHARIAELEARIVWLECELQVNAAPVSEAKAHGNYAPASVVWIDAHHVIEGNNPSFIKDVALVSAERIYETQIPLARLNAAPVQQPKCKTCDDNGRIGGPSFYAPDEGGEPCPDCSAPVHQVSVPAWMASSRAFADRLYMAGWRDHADAQHSGVAGMYDELLSSAPAAPAADGWIPVSERLPAVESRLDQECRAGTLSIAPLNVSAAVLVFDGEKVRSKRLDWFDGCLPLPYCITHWMPLPAAPAAHSAKGVV